jgi:CubicO group peptidase (beta-lactamase class C family)
MASFVPDTFTPPAGLDGDAFRLRPLGREHNDSDYGAWTSSIDHIHATPGYEGATWPHPMTPDENRRDLEAHAADFAARKGFTYTVLAREEGAVMGCVYIYPSEKPEFDVRVRSWVRAQDADLDAVLYTTVRDWLRHAWPFKRVEYAARPTP